MVIAQNGAAWRRYLTDSLLAALCIFPVVCSLTPALDKLENRPDIAKTFPRMDRGSWITSKGNS